jgi:hypothetical protein
VIHAREPGLISVQFTCNGGAIRLLPRVGGGQEGLLREGRNLRGAFDDTSHSQMLLRESWVARQICLCEGQWDFWCGLLQ